MAPSASEEKDIELEQWMQQDVREDSRMDTTITSVGRRNQRLSETAAAAYVITQDDIRRSGATNIPDVLRMVPGLDVVRVDSNKWAVGSRGFNGRLANKLLVLMDGREVYSPTFGGVYWEVQDTSLHDIERIEVIRGPGASLWGANAVNGVINIITQSAHKTTGGRLTAGGGTYEKKFGSFRYGAYLDKNTTGRVWAQGFNRGSFDNVASASNNDAWDMARTGFRLDRDARQGSSFTLLGNAYSGTPGQTTIMPSLSPPYSQWLSDRVATSGFNLLGRWKKALSLDSEMSLQGYYDHTYRRELFTVEERNTFDLEFQHHFHWGERQELTWGLGYRLSQDRIGNTPYNLVDPNQTNRQLFSAFLQDDISLIENTLTLTLGAKLQHNDYTGVEGQPNLRLLWIPVDKHTFWGAISRAVRTPARAERDLRTFAYMVPPLTPQNPSSFPVGFTAQGNRNYRAEELLAYELGYRFQPKGSLSFDIALFYNDYDSLRSFDSLHPELQFQPYVNAIVAYGNQIKARTYGAEGLLNWRPLPWCSLEMAYSWLKMDVRGAPGIISPETGTSPQQQLSTRTSFDLGKDLDWDLWFRFVDRLPLQGTLSPGVAAAVPGYVTLDSRLAWRPYSGIELSVTGQNLLDGRHLEFAQEGFPPPRSFAPRSVYFKLDWQF